MQHSIIKVTEQLEPSEYARIRRALRSRRQREAWDTPLFTVAALGRDRQGRVLYGVCAEEKGIGIDPYTAAYRLMAAAGRSFRYEVEYIEYSPLR